MIIKQKIDNNPIRIDGSTELVRITDASDHSSIDIVEMRINGSHGWKKNLRSSKLFYVIQGTLILKQRSGDSSSIRTGGVAIVPSGEEVEIVGENVVALLVCAPAYSNEDEL